MWKNKLYEVFANEAKARDVPMALHPAYVNERVHYKLLINEHALCVSEFSKAPVYHFFPLSEVEGLEAHLMKAKCSVLAAEDDCTWHDLIVTKAEQKNVVRARRNYFSFLEETRLVTANLKFIDIDEQIFNLLTS